MSVETQDRELSVFQKVLTAIVPRGWAEDMEADSRRWMLQCPECLYERSFWDIGGIRYKAVGNQRNYMPCPNCGKRSWHRAYRREDSHLGTLAPVSATTSAMPETAASGTKPSLRWLKWPMLLVPLVALIVSIGACALGIVLLVTTLVQPIVTVGDGFMTALKANNDTQAYALCAPDLQADVRSVEGLASRIQGYRPAQWSWSTRSIRNGVGRLEGTYSTSNGKSGTVRLILHQVDNDWKIIGFQFT